MFILFEVKTLFIRGDAPTRYAALRIFILAKKKRREKKRTLLRVLIPQTRIIMKKKKKKKKRRVQSLEAKDKYSIATIVSLVTARIFRTRNWVRLRFEDKV